MEGLNDFREKEVFANTKDIFRALYENKNAFIRVEIYSNKTIQWAMEQKKEILAEAEAYYFESFAPYPGEITKTVKCNETWKPVVVNEKINNIDVSYFKSRMNERMVYACNESEAFYNNVTVIFHCLKQKKNYILEFFSPLDKNTAYSDSVIQNIRKLRCR